MKILGIETSCDETALCVIEGTGGLDRPSFKVLGTALFSQVKLHEQYGGVFPNLAKREHSKNLIPLLQKLWTELGETKTPSSNTPLSPEQIKHLRSLLTHEPELFEALVPFIESVPKPAIDTIAVTYGPGLEPALWVGINCAKALAYIWNIPVIPVNHMEGHIVSVLISSQNTITFPALALLISGGHTELVHIDAWTQYSIIGETRDDAVGEAFDKVARMLGLPYPGGPHISARAARERTQRKSGDTLYTLPRPMIHSHDFDFSFSGLKTAVLYMIKNIPVLTDDIKQKIAYEFEEAVVNVLLHKTKKALLTHKSSSLIIGGGVIANTYIREKFLKLEEEIDGLTVSIPEMNLATDNAVMIAVAGYIETSINTDVIATDPHSIVAQGNVRL